MTYAEDILIGLDTPGHIYNDYYPDHAALWRYAREALDRVDDGTEVTIPYWDFLALEWRGHTYVRRPDGTIERTHRHFGKAALV